MNHLHQQAFAQAAVCDPELADGPSNADRLKYSASWQNQVSPLPANAGFSGALLKRHFAQRMAFVQQHVKVEHDAVNDGAIIPRQAQRQATQRGHRARRANHLHLPSSDQIAQAVFAFKGV